MKRKIFGYPSSFLRFILLSYVLVSLPILVAAVYSTVTMNTLSHQNTRTVQDATLTTQMARDLVYHLTEMKRGLLQSAVMRDPALIAEFRSNGEEFDHDLREFSAMRPAQGAGASLNLLVQQVIAGLPSDQDESTQANYDKAMEALSQLERALPTEILRVELDINAEIASNEELAVSTQTSLLISLALSVFAAALIVLMFRRLIAVQMRQFERAVETLGAGRYTEKIHFSGPQDIRFLGEQLEWLRLRLNELDTQRHRFLRNVSHGLKTPLTVLREGAQLLADGISGTLSQQQQDIVKIMHENSRRLQRMIEDLLRAQQASLAVAGITTQPVRLDLICKQAMKDHQIQAGKRQIKLLAELPEVILEGVPDNLHKVVDNLLSNAIKFSPDRSQVLVKLQVKGDALALTVSDEGPGIPEHERELVFEPFYRGASTRSERVEGSGVGLAISRDFVTAHGGTLTILPVAYGTCLEVRLPLHQPRPTEGEPDHA